jgi:protein O-mannosyl-transferase
MNKNRTTEAAEKKTVARWYGAILVVITFIAFSPVLKNDFTNWDDDVYVTENPSIQGFSLHNVAKQFSSSIGYYSPLTMLTYMADFSMFRLHAAGYHFTSLLFHIFNALIVFALIARLSKNRFVGFLTALLFAIHPLRVESVAWISERKDVVSTFFFFLSLFIYTRYLEKRQRRFFFGCLAMFVCSLLSKPMAVSLPFVLVLIDYLVDKKPTAEVFMEKWPFFALSFGVSVLSYVTQSNYDAILDVPFTQRISLPFFGVLFYLYKTVVPFYLSALYNTDCGGFFTFSLLFPLMAIVVGAAVFFLARHSKKAVFGIVFYLITLLPVLQIIPIGSALVADRYTYVPMIGLYFLVAIGIGGLLRGSVVKNRAMRGMLTAAFCLIIVLFIDLTFKRCGIWKDSFTLWSDTIRRNPSEIAYCNLGTAVLKAGRGSEAIALYRKALSIDPALQLSPNYYLGYYNLGSALLQTGAQTEAVVHLRKALELNPHYAVAHDNLGIALLQTGKTQEGIDHLRKAIELKADYANAHYNLGTTLAQTGRADEGLVHLAKAVDINPNYAAAHDNLGRVLLQTGRIDEAIVHLRKAVDIDPTNAERFLNLGRVYMLAGVPEKAIPCFKQSIAINPSQIFPFTNLSDAFLQTGQIDSAKAAAAKAVTVAESMHNDTLVREIGENIKAIEASRHSASGTANTSGFMPQ